MLYEIKVIIIVYWMGNTINPPHPLPQIWQRINAKYLRHRFTQEIIEEHTLILPSQQQQIETINALKKRIALHHMSIAKVIYFKPTQEQPICSPLQSQYTLLIYTEYTGDTLQRVAEEKGERLYHRPCQCNQIFAASDYLRDHYGFFKVTPAAVFLGNRREKSTKLWINPQVEITEREFPSNEEQMCESLRKLLRYMKNNRICSCTTSEHIQGVQKIGKLSELREYVFNIHRARQQGKHKKSNSVIVTQPRLQQPSAPQAEDNKKAYSMKANSMPQKNEEIREPPKGNEARPKEYPQRHQPADLFYRPVLANPNPIKINFIYPKQQSKNRSLPQPQSQLFQEIPLEMPYTYLQAENSSRERSRSTLKDNVQAKGSLFSPQIPIAHSVTNSPLGAKLEQPPGNFTAREMQLPLHEVRQKITPARLPTTSRSPKLPKEPLQTKEAEQPPTILNTRYKRKAAQQQSNPTQNKDKPPSINSSGKFEKYKDAIKNYQEKLRQKFANSMGGVNPLAPSKAKHKLVARKATSSPPPKGSQFKQTKSLYNDSEDDPPTQSKDKNEPFEQSFAPYNYSKEQQPSQEYQYSHQSLEQKSIEEQQEEADKKLRQRLQKLQLQRELEKEKVMIQNEVQDPLKHNAMRDEYRNIRQKIKHKKQTFAQLKAEATKILEDLDY